MSEMEGSLNRGRREDEAKLLSLILQEAFKCNLAFGGADNVLVKGGTYRLDNVLDVAHTAGCYVAVVRRTDSVEGDKDGVRRAPVTVRKPGLLAVPGVQVKGALRVTAFGTKAPGAIHSGFRREG